MKTENNKEIVVLSTFEAVRKRSGMYIGNVSPIEEKIPIISNNKVKLVEKVWVPGFLHLIIEVLENALDEAKRCKGTMENIFVSINLDTNEVTIRDEGNGFHNASEIHKKTQKNVVRTALEELHAGSNFNETNNNILGTHGVGAAVTNILSSHFTVTTVNDTHSVHFKWEDFIVVDELIRKKTRGEKPGTTITFIPTPEVFKQIKWDKDIISFYLSYKSFLIKNDPQINNLKLVGVFIENGVEIPIEITTDFIGEDFVRVDNDKSTIYLWESYENSSSLSFINGSKCTGLQQKIVNDWCNDYFGYNLAHHFYETLIILNVPSNLMRFADQNKSKLDTSKQELESILDDKLKDKLLKVLKKSELGKNIENNIEDRLHNENMNKIRKAKRQSKRKITDKYSAPSRTKDCLYLTEGLCLEENTKIFIIRKNKILYCKIKDVKKYDLVITHKNNLKPIIHINKSIKQKSIITTNIGNIECSERHKWFVYDITDNTFYFEETINLNKDKHKLVKNYLSFLESFDEIKSVEIKSHKILIVNDKKEQWEISANNKICTFDIISNKFIMTNSNDLKIGDIITKLSTLSYT